MKLVSEYLARVGSPSDPRDRAFHTFARLEDAMKISGFERLHQDKRADTDWGKLAREVGEVLMNHALSEDGQKAISYLLAEPPKRELIGEAGPEWEVDEVKAANPGEQAILHVRRVRNNLIHGGKAIYRPNRDHALLTAALWVIEESLLAHSSLRAAFLRP